MNKSFMGAITVLVTYIVTANYLRRKMLKEEMDNIAARIRRGENADIIQRMMDERKKNAGNNIIKATHRSYRH